MADNKDEVTVAQNTGGEATAGTTQAGDTGAVQNTDSIPQNANADAATTPAPNETAAQADDARTQAEKDFANEANPNQKSNQDATQDASTDQDGNPRAGGYSYGVSDDDSDGTVPEPANAPEDKPAEDKNAPTPTVFAEPSANADFLNTDTNNEEWDVEKQQKLEDSLSDPKNGILARVTTSAGNYVRVKFFRNNKPFATYRSRNFKVSEAKDFLGKVRKDRDV